MTADEREWVEAAGWRKLSTDEWHFRYGDLKARCVRVDSGWVWAGWRGPTCVLGSPPTEELAAILAASAALGVEVKHG